MDAENLGATLRLAITSILGAVDATPPTGTSDGSASIPFSAGTEGQYAVNSVTNINPVSARGTLGVVPLTAGIGAVNFNGVSQWGQTLTFHI